MMSTTYSAPAAWSLTRRRVSLLATLRQCCAAYLGWRAERAAIAHLRAMSDRELRDIGLMRSHVTQAVQDTTLDRALGHRC
jgi:uncharacterized protein YjiS (DUF1127 family)